MGVPFRPMRCFPRRNHPSRVFLRGIARRLARWSGRFKEIPAVGNDFVAWSEPLIDGALRRHVVFVSGEPQTPGHAYRVERMARSTAELGHVVDSVTVDELEPSLWLERMRRPSVVVLWRVRHREIVERAVDAWRKSGAKIIFDVDDLMIDPANARPEVIDAIRSLRLKCEDVARLYAGIRRTMWLGDACVAPTATLAAAMRSAGRPAMVVENGFDAQTLETSRTAVLSRQITPHDGLVRIGYAAGSLTHQRDFAVAAPAVAAVLRGHSECRLVLFRGRRGAALLDVREFPDLVGLEDRIEWRPQVPLAELPAELARFDVNIAPLEVGNAFCEAKSELKYFEAALVGVATIASPTEPFRTAIRDGETGFLAATEAEWRVTLERLVVDASLRRRIGQAAFHDVLHRYGSEGRREALAKVFAGVHGAAEAAGSAVVTRAVAEQDRPRLPVVPESEVILRAGGGRIAEVAVVVPLYKYADVVAETLDSVAAQSLDGLELVIVDDGSTDASLAVAQDWISRHASRFVSVTLARNLVNQGVALTRNAGFALAEAPLVFPLDADNLLERECLRLLSERLRRSHASAAHPTLHHFGDRVKRRPARAWSPERLARGNYIDAMALIRKSAWAHVGGYRKGAFVGWEDYELWCRFVERGLWSAAVPAAVARYRVHAGSMLQSDTAAAMQRVVDAIRAEHPWLRVRAA